MKLMMKQLESHSARLLAGAFGLFLVLALAPAGIAQKQSGKTAAALATPATSATTAPSSAKMPGEEDNAAAPSNPGSEGIKVHGHWVLQVKNADGTLGERREFNNSLVGSGGMLTGDQILAALLSGNGTAGGLAVAFISGPTTKTGLDVSSFCDYAGPGAPEAGQIAVPTGISCFGLYPSGSVFSSSQLEVSQQGQTGLSNLVSFSPSVNIVLSGNFAVPSALGTLGAVNAVQTYAAFCTNGIENLGNGYRLSGSNLAFQQATQSPSYCTGTPTGAQFIGVLTSTNISSGGVPAPLPVVTGQIITVTVTLSFS